MYRDQALGKIDVFDFDFLREKYFESNSHDFNETVGEFKKFLKLILLQDKPLAVISKSVDELWHVFLLFTPQYQEFCQDVFGEFIHHQPHTLSTPVPEEALTNFFAVYTEHYGEPGPVWVEEYPPALISSLRQGSVPSDFMYAWSGWTGRSAKL